MDWKDIKALFANTPKNPEVWGDDMGDSDEDDDDSDPEDNEFEQEDDAVEPIVDVKALKKKEDANSDNSAQAKRSGPVVSVVTTEEPAAPAKPSASAPSASKHTQLRSGLKQQAAQSGESLYGRQMDSRDEQWVAKQRPKTAHASDATLSCPACFTTVCFDCQQHTKYKNQFRAMFVRNCTVKRDQRLQGAPGEEYIPVACATCAVEIAVLDQDEVYHFFNVIPGEPPLDTNG